jgi:hypothetical protein
MDIFLICHLTKYDNFMYEEKMAANKYTVCFGEIDFESHQGT